MIKSGGYEERGMEQTKMHSKVSVEKLKERVYFEDLVINYSKMLKWN
jgi:hypothetical protein